jgi:erythromycin esterase-like protein
MLFGEYYAPMLLRLAIPLALAVPAFAQEKSPITEWIAGHAIPLSTVEARHGFADLQPLKKVIGDARIVELGEATHGTREFFQLKHRMLEFLATEMGFTIFSIEANMPEAYKLNDYVLRGEGDPAKLLKGMYFWTWDTEEVLDMIRWMREFNQSGKGRVEFTGFDMQTITVAGPVVRNFVAKFDPDYGETVESAIATAQKARPPVQNFGTATGTFPLSAAAGKKLRYSGFIKTENVEGAAGLWWRVDGTDHKTLAFNNMQQLHISGTTDWKEYSFELPVAPEARNINFGMLLSGGGTAWFDDLKVELDGAPYTDPSLFDFTFESSAPKGFSTGFGGYSIVLDHDVAHSGKQSLRIRRTAPATATDAVGPKTAAAAWKDVIGRLEAGRDTYLKKDAAAKDIDWAIQNARVVLQCMQMRANQVTRDHSMAVNIKWILDHSPGAKMVVWAHNGHVQTSGLGYAPMGADLRQMFPNQMVVMGFSFNQGSFQARSQSTGELKNFTVPPAPEGSLDATLASTGLPRLALDLRQAPQTGPVADWFHTAHQTRSIGAVYPEDSPFAFLASFKAPEAFDAILFVANTTFAHKNPGW